MTKYSANQNDTTINIKPALAKCEHSNKWG